MTTILKTLLEKTDSTENVLGSYIDDIFVDETEMPVQRAVEHLSMFYLITNPPESLRGGAALELRLHKDMAGDLAFRRRNKIPEVVRCMIKR